MAAVVDRLAWLRTDPDPEVMRRIKREEIERALSSTPVPRDWAPVEVEPWHLR